METNCLFHPSGKITHAEEEAELNVPFSFETPWHKMGRGVQVEVSSCVFSCSRHNCRRHRSQNEFWAHWQRVPHAAECACLQGEHAEQVLWGMTDSHHTSDSHCTARGITGTCLNLGQNSSFEVSASLCGFVKGRSYLNPKWNSMSGIPRSEAGADGAGRTCLSQKQ